jgi:hypothetical protein
MSDTIKFPLAALEQLCNEIDTSASDEIESLERERDEARAVANELADIASHCLGWHDHESVETAEKLTNALKRWRNLK